jgi:hypothetical protein
VLLVLAAAFLYPALRPGYALVPAQFLQQMSPWDQETTQNQPQWNPLLWDGVAQFYPWRVHLHRSVAEQGTLPLWNPHQFSGTPFLANAQTAVLYPLNILFVIFEPVRAFGLSAMLHLFLAGLFAFIFSRALGIGRFGATVSGVSFAFCSFMVLWLELPTLVNVATWLPLVLYLILRSWDRTGAVHAMLSGAVLGVAILAGHLQIASYLIFAAAIWWIWLAVSRTRIDGFEAVTRGLKLAAVSFAVAFLVAAPQVLPTIELAGLSHRVRQVTAEGYAAYLKGAIPLRQMVTLFIPNFFGSPAIPGGYFAGSAANYMEYGMYTGIMPFLLAIFGAIFTIRWRAVGYFILLGLVSFLLAIGTPLNAPFYYLVPGTSALGGPNRTIILFCFAIAMLAGYGAHWFAQLATEEYRATRRKLGWRALTIGGALFTLIFVTCQSITSASLQALGIDPSQIITAALPHYVLFGVMLLGSLGVLVLYTAGQLPKGFFAFLAVSVIVADLFTFGIGFNPVSKVKDVYPQTKLTAWLTKNAGQTRLMPINPHWSLEENPGAILPPNAATVYGLFDVQGYDSLFYRNYKEFVDHTLGVDSSPRENGNMLLVPRYVPDWPQGTAGIVLSKEPIKAKGLKLLTQADGVRVYQRTAFGQYNRSCVLPAIGDTAKPVSRSWIVDETPNSVIVLAETNRPSRLILADAFYPGWKAYVNDQERRVTPADGVFRSVEIDPGSQSVVFRYEPESYVVGIFAGLVGIGIVAAALGMAIARRQW